MVKNRKIRLKGDLKGIENRFLHFLYAPILKAKTLAVLLHLRCLTTPQKTVIIEEAVLFNFIKMPLETLQLAIKELEKYQLLKQVEGTDWEIILLPVKTITEFFADPILVKALEHRLSPGKIDMILFSLVNLVNEEKLRILSQVRLPQQILQQAKLKDFYTLDRIHRENHLSLAIWQKIVDFVWVKTTTINSTYLEKLICTLKEKQILEDEEKVTAYLLKLFRQQRLAATTQQLASLPIWITNREEKAALAKSFSYSKLFRY